MRGTWRVTLPGRYWESAESDYRIEHLYRGAHPLAANAPMLVEVPVVRWMSRAAPRGRTPRGAVVTGYALPRGRQPEPTAQSDLTVHRPRGRQPESAAQSDFAGDFAGGRRADASAVRCRGVHGRLQSRRIVEGDPVAGWISPAGNQTPGGRGPRHRRRNRLVLIIPGSTGLTPVGSVSY